MSKTTKKNLTKEIAQELDVFDKMLCALVELLEEKGIMTQQKWEIKVKKKIEGKKGKLTIEIFNLVDCAHTQPTYRIISLLTIKILIGNA